MGRRLNASPGLLPFLIFVISAIIGFAVGCGVGPVGMVDERGKRDEPNVTSLDGAYLPAGFGEGSLWVTDILACDDTSGGQEASCGFSGPMFLKRLDPRTGEVEAKVNLGGFFANTVEVAFGAGSIWVSSTDYGPGPVEKRQPYDAVYKVDPETNRLVDRIPVDSPTGVDFGFGSVWTVSASHGTVSRVDPETGKVTAKIKVGRGAVDIAVDKRSGAVWVAGLYLPKDYDGVDPRGNPEYNKLSRVDPRTNRVVAEIPIGGNSPDSGVQNVAVGERAVWVTSDNGKLYEVDPTKNKVAAAEPLGDYFSDLKVSGGSLWVSGQNGSGTWLKRVNPRTVEVDWSHSLGPAESGGYGRLVADKDRLWFVEGARTGKGTLVQLSR